MQIHGVQPRAAAAKAALNRLHTEVAYALGELPGSDRGGLPAGFTEMDLAEVLAIAVQIGKLVDKHIPTGDPQRARFENALSFQLGNHEVPR